MTELTTPRLNANEERYTVVAYHVAAGDAVREGQLLVTIRSTKASAELESPAEGYVELCSAPGAEVAVAAPLARIHADEAACLAASAAPPSDAQAGYKLTRKAAAFADAEGIDAAWLEANMTGLVRREQLQARWREVAQAAEALAQPDDERPWQVLSPFQSEVARVVARSQREIPTAYALLHLDVSRLLPQLERLAEQLGLAVGLEVALVRALQLSFEDFPECFAAVDDALRWRRAAAADVAITMDAGAGLFMPVVRAADYGELAAIAERIDELRYGAMRASLSAAELADAAISISINPSPGLITMLPILPPGQSAMLSIGAVETQLVLSPQAALESRSVVYLGLVYDHRLINGALAARFLEALRRALDDVCES